MRISELSESTGVSVATIKYYVREGLLSPGRKLAERLADYDDQHVRRLRLLRVLRDVGAVPVGALKALVEATQDRRTTIHDMFGEACDALRVETAVPATPDEHTRELADRIVERAGWDQVRPDAPERDQLAAIIRVILDSGLRTDPEGAATYLPLVDAIAAYEIDQVDDSQDRETMMEQMVLGQVVLGEFLLSLRRLAHEHHSALRFDGRG
ncbi:DNA-binding transcriptional MerR regulator [Nocardioides luteus]|uniref:Transcriptional regulator n=1 Tax=Nocardioides luteus TaxID=1844 RepID=A0ABQ5SS42_9ACTN|nr:MerR family transcriptional regulator [Nocardioides luteus]MDR7310136.1 DNA-binding transcriptional MerR regulator [Nocardioides luteus]GGR64575.1 transcriptional regulator [Nocardioides luteus]GLJ66957.1 transcriptional regulator [Nocardioides luteus]